MKKLVFSSLLLLSLATIGVSQTLYGISTVWDDNFSEWTVYADNEEGYLKIKWLNDPSEWEYYINSECFGTIRLKWKDDPTHWEVRGNNGEIITARTQWPNDLSQWRITNNNKTINLKPIWGNDKNEWKFKNSQSGLMHISTEWENDFRDWGIDDKTINMSIHMKMAIVFLTIFHSTPY